MKTKKTIGVLIGQIGDRYHSQMWPTLIDLGKKHNIGLLLFIGQSLIDPVDFRTQENVVYSFADKQNVDGLIVFGSLGNYLSDEEFKSFLDQYGDIPKIIVSRKIEGIPSVTVDNYNGMFELVEHMIVEHGRNKIAFIRGMPKNPEAEKRYQAYQAALKAHGIPLDEELVATGTFAGPTGAEAVTELLDERKAKFDCLVAANDDMLLWAHKVLVERKINVPIEVSIGGFDNLPETQLSDPPITTVEQPLALLAYRAGEVLIDIMEGKKLDTLDHTVPAKTIIRKSCGCFTKYDRKAEFQGTKSDTISSEEDILALLEKNMFRITGEVMIALHSSEYPRDVLGNFIRELLETFLGQIRSPEKDTLIQPLIERILSSEKVRYATDFWKGAFNIMEDIVNGNLENHQGLHGRASVIFKNWRYIITEIGIRSFNNERKSFWTMQWSLLGITQALSTTFDIERIKDVLIGRQFSEFELYACNICLYEKSGVKLEDLGRVPSDRSRLIFFNNHYRKIGDEVYQGDFATKDIAPFDLFADDRIEAWGVFPLLFENIHFGFMSFELHKYNYYNYIIPNTLRESISSSMKGALLIQELKNTQGQLFEAAKIAREANNHKSKLLINMSHELRTPLNSVNGITEILEAGGYEKTEEVVGDIKEMLKYFEGKDVRVKGIPDVQKHLKKYIKVSQESGNTKPMFFSFLKSLIEATAGKKQSAIIKIINRIVQSLNSEHEETLEAYKHIKEAGVYLLGLIDMVLNLTKVEAGKIDVFRTKVAVRSLLDSVINDSENYARSKKKDAMINLQYSVDMDVPDTCFVDKQKVKEVLLNLISNGIKYTSMGTVMTHVSYDGSNIRFDVKDNGIGINESERDKIFTEFGRTDDAKGIEGTGLGLMLSKKLVELMNGEIGFRSEHGAGSTFWFTVPVRK